MYTPPVTPWESVTPEVSDPTHISEHDVSEGYEIDKGDFITFDKRIRRESYGIHRKSCLVMWEGAAEGGTDNWGEVVTR